MHGVVGDSDGVAKGAPMRDGSQTVRRRGRLRQFPHTGHKRSFGWAVHQTALALAVAAAVTICRAPVQSAPDLCFLLANGWLPNDRLLARSFSLRRAPSS